MKVPSEIKKAVAFVCYLNQVTQDLVPVGSVFFLGHDPVDGVPTSRRVYAVTAKHVIDAWPKKIVRSLYSAEPQSGRSRPLGAMPIEVKNWFSHPLDKSIDVAIAQAGIPIETEQRLYRRAPRPRARPRPPAKRQYHRCCDQGTYPARSSPASPVRRPHPVSA